MLFIPSGMPKAAKGRSDLQIKKVAKIIREAKFTEGWEMPGSPGSTTAGPNHSQKKSLILAQKER